MIKKTFAVAFAGILAGVGILFAPTADAAAKPDDCHRVATADRTLCRLVQLQHPYGRSFDGTRYGAWSNPSGKALVKEITHSGYTKREMHDELAGEASQYRLTVTAVPVDMDAIKRTCGNTDGYWAVQFVDADGKPGGTKLTYKHVVCA